MWRSDLLGFHGDTLGWINTKLTQQILTANNPIPGKNIKRPSETMLDVEDENIFETMEWGVQILGGGISVGKLECHIRNLILTDD